MRTERGTQRRRFLLRVGGALLLIGAAPASAAEEAWKLEKDHDGIRIESRAVPGWTIREMRGTTTVPAPLPAVVAVLDDTAAIPKLNDVVAEARVEHRESALRYRIYAAMKMPWPVSDRDIVNQRENRQDPASGVVTLVDTAVPGAQPRKGYTRIEKSRQEWVLTPQADGSTLAELRLLSDPGGIPASIINSMAVSSPYKTLKSLRELARQPSYARQRPQWLAPAAPAAGSPP